MREKNASDSHNKLTEDQKTLYDFMENLITEDQEHCKCFGCKWSKKNFFRFGKKFEILAKKNRDGNLGLCYEWGPSEELVHIIFFSFKLIEGNQISGQPPPIDLPPDIKVEIAKKLMSKCSKDYKHKTEKEKREVDELIKSLAEPEKVEQSITNSISENEDSESTEVREDSDASSYSNSATEGKKFMHIPQSALKA